MYTQKVLVVLPAHRTYNNYYMYRNYCDATLPFDFHDSLSELPELHLEIVCNDDCMDQLSCLTLTPSFGISSVTSVGIIFLTLACTPETHSYLAQPHFIERLLKGCYRDWQNDDVLRLK